MFIKKLSTENFGPFDSGVFNFSPAVNVLVGPNATGKTYVLKVLYAFLRATARRGAGTKSSVQSLLTDFLVKTFRPLDGKLGKLARNVPGGSSARVRLEVEEPRASLEFGFGKKSKQVEIGEFSEYERVLGWAEEGEGLRPEVIYIPSNEVLTFASKNLRLIYEQKILRIEEPIIHLLELAKYGVQKGPKDREREELLSILKSYYEEEGSLLNPRVKGINYLEDTESFEVREEGVSVEAFLSSEGYRKLGLILTRPISLPPLIAS